LAFYALVGSKQEFFVEGFALRVVTPLTGKRTAFEEDCGAYAGSIVDGKPLDVED
jgi:hypothetical protein